jgi:hypothetical protein
MFNLGSAASMSPRTSLVQVDECLQIRLLRPNRGSGLDDVGIDDEGDIRAASSVQVCTIPVALLILLVQYLIPFACRLKVSPRD